jgi:hypothetical protein
MVEWWGGGEVEWGGGRDGESDESDGGRPWSSIIPSCQYSSPPPVGRGEGDRPNQSDGSDRTNRRADVPGLPSFHHASIPVLPQWDGGREIGRISWIGPIGQRASLVFYHSSLPSFHHSIIPSSHHSIIPSFHHSTIPPFQYSIIPIFHHPNIPPFPPSTHAGSSGGSRRRAGRGALRPPRCLGSDRRVLGSGCPRRRR